MRPKTVLAFDTSAAHCAAALLLSDGQCLVLREEMAKGQAERLLPLLEELLAKGGIAWSDLNAVAVGTGPGNFTGVRIAVAAARGLALSLAIPAIGITRLEALAYGLPRPLTILEDARRDEVYHQQFGADQTGPASLMARADLDFATLGPVSGSAAGEDALANPTPLEEAMARLAEARLSQSNPAAIPRPAPFYLRGADAAPPSDPPPVILDA